MVGFQRHILLLSENSLVRAFYEMLFEGYRHLDVHISQLFHGNQLNLSVILRNLVVREEVEQVKA